MRNIVRYLTNCTKIPGVNGFGNWGLIEQATGKRDGKDRQLSESDGAFSTPWIEKKHNLFKSYKNKIFLKTNSALEGIYKEVHSKHVEYKLLSNLEVDNSNINGEEGLRQAAAIANKVSSSEKRREEILIRMAEIKGFIEAVDKALLHNLERSESILHSHVSAYWRGLVKSSTKELPAYPGIEVKEVSGKLVYEKHLQEIRTILDKLLV